jgi:hypothetical protein
MPTPAERSLIAVKAAETRWSQEDPKTSPALQRARKASPQSLDYWAAKVDPDGSLPPAERERRAVKARRAHMAGMSLKASQARRAKAAARKAAAAGDAA